MVMVKIAVRVACYIDVGAACRGVIAVVTTAAFHSPDDNVAPRSRA